MNISRRHLAWLGGTGFLATLLTNQAQSTAQQRPSMNDQAKIINTVNGIGIFADLRDWKRCRQNFADKVEFDYTSMLGGQPSTVAADQQIQQWATFFDSTFRNTQHLIGSHVIVVNGDKATCVSNFQAHHTYLDSKRGAWVLSGFYNHDLVRAGNAWRVNKMKMTIAWETGNRPS